MIRTHIDLFSGIGGFALACRWAGVETIGFAEIDDYASKVLAKNFPGVVNYGDIRNVPPTDDVWLVTGGFPCQPFSVAGKQRGADDDRWLWPEMAACIERIRPRWVLAENVPGIVGMELDKVFSDLEAIDYTTWAVVVPAVAVDAPHRRDRVWIVAHADATERRAHDSARQRIQGRNDADSIPGRQEISGRSQLCGAEDVAHADAIRWDGRTRQQRQGWRTESANSCADVPNRNGAGLAQREGIAGDDGAQQPAIVGTDRRQPEPRLGRVVDGLPAGMDGAARWEPEPDIPRIANGVADRVNRLKGLGNAIVPQVAYQLIRMMIEVEQENNHE